MIHQNLKCEERERRERIGKNERLGFRRIVAWEKTKVLKNHKYGLFLGRKVFRLNRRMGRKSGRKVFGFSR